MDHQTNISGLKRKLAENDAQRACKVPRSGFVHRPSPCSPGHAHHFCPPRPIMVENCFNFLQTGLPKRVMYYRKGQWCDFPEPVRQTLVEGFKMKKSANEVTFSGKSLLVDFLSMVLINLMTRTQRSVAWIDENDKCFFPSSFFDDDVDDAPEIESDTIGRVAQSPSAGTPSAPQVEVIKSVVLENGTAVTPQTRTPNFLCTKIETLERHSEGFLFVQKLFLSGMGSFASPQNILHIHRYAPKDAPAKMRLEMFERQIKATEEVRGNANVQYGWYGAGKRDVVSVLVHGFGLADKPAEGGALGSGIYVTPEGRTFASVNLCDGDEKGLQYMILCRAVLGNVEQIQQGSKQYRPSSDLYDSGTDDLSCPRCYIIWSTHLRSYIHPEYVITFKLTPDVEEYLSGLKDIRFHLGGMKRVQDLFTCYPVRREMYKGPTSPWMSFTMLFSELQDSISPVAKELLYHHYDELKNKIITREELIKKIKVIVGTELLSSTLHRLKHNPSLWCNESTAQKLDSDPSSEISKKLNDSNALPEVPTNSVGPTMNRDLSTELTVKPKDVATLMSEPNVSVASKFKANDTVASRKESSDTRI